MVHAAEQQSSSGVLSHELRALNTIEALFSTLDHGTIRRVIQWADARFLREMAQQDAAASVMNRAPVTSVSTASRTAADVSVSLPHRLTPFVRVQKEVSGSPLSATLTSTELSNVMKVLVASQFFVEEKGKNLFKTSELNAFVKRFGHVFLNLSDSLYRLRQKGYVSIPAKEGDQNHYTLTPEGTEEVRRLVSVFAA